MAAIDDLPIILISAANDIVAEAVISELIDNDVTLEYTKDSQFRDRIWRLVNKYYTADVRVHALTDDRQLELNTQIIEAQVIHITQEELCMGCGGVSRVTSRAVRSHDAWRSAHVRVVLVDCALDADAVELSEWCARPPHAALVARLERAPSPPRTTGAFLESYGVQRARDELHAHTWTNMIPTATNVAKEEGEVKEEEEEEPSVEEQWRMVEQIQTLAGALSALHDARTDTRAARLERAESVLRAVCRAVGLRPDELD